MRLILLVALATAAAATSLFRPGEEYIYHYKGHVLSGIPKASKQFAGLLIDTIVTFQFQQDYKVVMKLDKIKLFKVNHEISTPPEEPLREEELTLLTGEQTHVLTEYLIKPIKFRYVEGEIQEIEKETSDRYWSVNIKKGILSLFQVTLKDKTPTTDYSMFEPTPQRLRQTPYNSRNPMMTSYWKLNKNVGYTVMETDVTGTCETKYTLITDKTHITSTTTEMHVTAVRDFNTCTTEPFYIQGAFQGVYIHPDEEPLLEPMVETSYILNGDRSHFLIKEAKLRGKYSFRVHGLDGGSMTSFILQTLKLKTTQPISRPKILTGPILEKHGLLMVIPDATQIPVKKGSEEMSPRSVQSGWSRRSGYPVSRDYLRDEEEDDIRTVDISSIIPVVEEKLTKLVECVYTPTETHCSEILIQIARILRDLPHPVLKTIVTKYITMTTTSDIEYRKSEVLLDLLPTLISPASSKVIIELIKDRRISELRGSLMINAMSIVAKPTPSVVNSVLEFFKELPKEPTSKLRPRTLLRQSLILGVGTMTHRMINVMRSHGKPMPEILNFIETISGEFKKFYGETSSKHEKILIISAMGNLGASQTIPLLKSIIEDTAEPVEVRAFAILSLRRLVKQFRKQVMPILLTVYMDTKEEVYLRKRAFLVIIQAKPGFTTLQMIGHRLRHEPSQQLRTLVYSNLVNLAMSSPDEPEHKELKHNALLVVKSIPPVFIGPYDSFTVKFSKFNEDYDMGASVSFTKLKSKFSGIADALSLKLQGTYLGKHRDLLLTGVNGKSVEKVLRKVFGPHGMLSEFLKGKVTLEEFIRPFVNFEWSSVEMKVKELLGKTLSDMTPEEKPTAFWFLRLLDHKIQHVFLTTETLDEVIEKVSMLIPEIISKLSRGLKVDIIKSIYVFNSLTIASPIGIPLTINSTLSGVGKVDGFIKVHNLPTVTDMFRTRSFSLPKIGLDVDLKPAFDVVHYLTVGCNMRWINTGVYLETYVESTVPTKVNVHFKGPEHEISIKKFVPKQPVVLLHAKATPNTFISYIPTTVHKLPSTFETKEILNKKIVKSIPFEHKYKCTFSGLEMETKGVFSVCGPQWCPTMPLFGKQSITIMILPHTPVEYVHIKVKSLKSNIELEGIPASRPTEELYGYEMDEETDSDLYPESVSRKYYRRPSSTMMVTPGEFDNIPTDPSFTMEPIKRQILVTVGPNTYQSPKVKALFTWLMSRHYWKNQLNLQVVRLSHEEIPAWKINVNSLVNPLAITNLVPVIIPTTWYPTTEPTLEYLTKTHITWLYGSETNELKVKLIPGSPIDFSRELSEHQIFTAFNLPEARAQKYKFTLETEVSRMSHTLLKFINIAHDALQYQLYYYTTTTVPTTPSLNKVLVAFELLPIWEQLNIVVKTPIQNSYIANVPFYLNPWFPTNEKVRLHDIPSWLWMKNFTYELESPDYIPREEDWVESYNTVPYKPTPVIGGECSVTGRTTNDAIVTSFDGASRPLTSLFKYFKSGCHVTLSKLCTNENLFKVTAFQPTEDFWKVKVMIPSYEVEVKSESGRLSVFINGEEKNIYPGRPLILTEDSYTETSPKILKVEKLDSNKIELKLYELGAKIYFTEDYHRTLKLELLPWSTLQGELCGVCGNFNLDQSDDYTISESMNIPRHPTYFESSVLPSDTCNVDEVYSTEDEICKTEKHVTLKRYENEVPMICRSERKITQCTPGCVPVNTVSTKVCYTCTTESGMSLPRTTYYTPRWEDDRDEECSGFYHRVEVPTTCIPVY